MCLYQDLFKLKILDAQFKYLFVLLSLPDNVNIAMSTRFKVYPEWLSTKYNDVFK